MIILAATPIGNLGDASKRLVQAFEEATVIAAEDTRMTAQLLRLLEVTNRPELISLNEHNETDRVDRLIERASTEDVLVVSDAGMPTVSDPGFRLVQKAHEEGVRVSVLPGPSAVISALAISGLPTDRFVFEGFFPRKLSERTKLASLLQEEPRTTVLFESPNRLHETLTFLATELDVSRQVAVCREITKLHEEVIRGTLEEVADLTRGGVRGEIVLVLAGAPPVVRDVTSALPEALRLVAGGERLKDVTKRLAKEFGISSRELYEAALAASRKEEE